MTRCKQKRWRIISPSKNTCRCRLVALWHFSRGAEAPVHRCQLQHELLQARRQGLWTPCQWHLHGVRQIAHRCEYFRVASKIVLWAVFFRRETRKSYNCVMPNVLRWQLWWKILSFSSWLAMGSLCLLGEEKVGH